jgi:hypothetical protein
VEFGEAWKRYLAAEGREAPSKGQQAQQASIDAGFQSVRHEQQRRFVALNRAAKDPINTRVVADVAPLNRFSRTE